ncbi:MAG: N-acetyltransferase [Candidatus Competibacteraceae bacterium]|jgi:ribosomal protein S18 acetylase RimI-like enzyme|nr:N-acetyltransferase [Candidatus Competibacteraceae bacterium]
MLVSTIGFRPIQDHDLPFLEALYASTRQDEMAATGWTEQQIAEFLAMQFRAQHDHYQQHYPKAHFDLILVGDEPVGRLYLDEWDDEFRLIDIALIPAYRNRGLGTRLLRDVLDRSEAAGKAVRIHVEHFNPALRWYQRLGFYKLEDKGVYCFMEWKPGCDQHASQVMR